jgi:hypothetical protein
MICHGLAFDGLAFELPECGAERENRARLLRRKRGEKVLNGGADFSERWS